MCAPVIYPWYLLYFTPFLWCTPRFRWLSGPFPSLAVYVVWRGADGGRWMVPRYIEAFGVWSGDRCAIIVLAKRSSRGKDVAVAIHGRAGMSTVLAMSLDRGAQCALSHSGTATAGKQCEDSSPPCGRPAFTLLLALPPLHPRARSTAQPQRNSSPSRTNRSRLHGISANACPQREVRPGGVAGRVDEHDERGFRYEIVSERGSDYARNKVLKTVLKTRTGIDRRRTQRTSDAVRRQLRVHRCGTNVEGVRYVLLKPKRKDVLLVDGRMVLTRTPLSCYGSKAACPRTHLSGPTRSTSFVTTAVSTACASPSRPSRSPRSGSPAYRKLEVHYDYESINGRPVSLSARRMLSSLR